MYSCLAWCAICTYTVDAEMEMSTWLHDSWIGSNMPTSAGKEGCVTSADGVAMAMEWQMSWIRRKSEIAAMNVTL